MNTLSKAINLYEDGELIAARRLCEEAIEQNPESVVALDLLGTILAQLHQPMAAIDYFKQALLIDPDASRIHNHLANAYTRNKAVSEAEKHYQKAISLNPQYAEAYHNLAGLYYRQDRLSDALCCYAKAVHIKPDYIETHYHLGLLFIKQGKIKEAKIQLHNVIRLNPYAQQAHYHLANLALQANALDDAQHHYQQVLAIDSEHIDSLNNSGVIHLKKDEPQQAIDYFSKVLALDNDHLEARNNIAATFIQYDRYENAIIHYQALLEHQPDNVEANFNIAVAFMSLGQFVQAKQHYQRVLAIEPKHVDVLSNLGAIYLREQQRDQAISCFQAVLALQPTHTMAKYMLAVICDPQSVKTAPTDYISNLFDRYALYYEKHLLETLKYAIPEQLVEFIIKVSNLKPDKWRVLDLGCGTGLAGSAMKKFAAHLTGVDVSEKMLNIAREKTIYNELIHEDCQQMLDKGTEKYELIVAADVFAYLGDLTAIFSLCQNRLTRNGLFAFSIETGSDHVSFELQTTARFSHSKNYINTLAMQAGFIMEGVTDVMGRLQDNKPVPMNLFVLRLAADQY